MLKKLLLSAAMLAMFANPSFAAANNANINQGEIEVIFTGIFFLIHM